MKKNSFLLLLAAALTIAVLATGNRPREDRQLSSSGLTTAAPETLKPVYFRSLKVDECYPDYCVRIDGPPGDTSGWVMIEAGVVTRMSVKSFKLGRRDGKQVIKELVLEMSGTRMK